MKEENGTLAPEMAPDLEQILTLDPEIKVQVQIPWPELNQDTTLQLMDKALEGDMTLKKLKDLSGLHQNTISNLRNGKTVGPDSLIKILKALGYKIRITV